MAPCLTRGGRNLPSGLRVELPLVLVQSPADVKNKALGGRVRDGLRDRHHGHAGLPEFQRDLNLVDPVPAQPGAPVHQHGVEATVRRSGIDQEMPQPGEVAAPDPRRRTSQPSTSRGSRRTPVIACFWAAMLRSRARARRVISTTLGDSDVPYSGTAVQHFDFPDPYVTSTVENAWVPRLGEPGSISWRSRATAPDPPAERTTRYPFNR